MKTKIRNITIILILAIIILFPKTVKAESKVEMQLTSSDTKLIAGQSVEVTLSITNIDAGNGIDAIVGKINYDENVFEEKVEIKGIDEFDKKDLHFKFNKKIKIFN